jgi:hypothetical protein
MSTKDDRDNHANQLNPNNAAYHSSRGGTYGGYDDDDADGGCAYVPSYSTASVQPPPILEEYVGCWGHKSGVLVERGGYWGGAEKYYVDHFYVDLIQENGQCEKLRFQTHIAKRLDHPKESALKLAQEVFSRRIEERLSALPKKLVYACLAGPAGIKYERVLVQKAAWEPVACDAADALLNSIPRADDYQKEYVNYVIY